MKIYHVETQQDYDALMNELEEKGFEWFSGGKPTSKDYWSEEKSCIKISGKSITFGSIERHKKEYPDTPIIEYKAKGENMLNTECKQCHKKWHHTNAKYCAMCGKKLIAEPDFKVDDYVTVYVNGRKIITKIDELRENKKEAHGLWYDKTKVNVKQDYWFLTKGNKFRYSTPTEITEYEAALTFHKHGRKPFEVKGGDMLRDNEVDIFFVDFPSNWEKEYFTSGRFTFLKTVEEVNEWLENK